MNEHYILEGGEIKTADLMTWAAWLESDKDFSKRRISETFIGDIHISTVFLGLNHNFGAGKPLLFETMVFGGEHDQFCMRYSILRKLCADMSKL